MAYYRARDNGGRDGLGRPRVTALHDDACTVTAQVIRTYDEAMITPATQRMLRNV
ncbi:MAG: hypothetical protein H0V63_07350 [Burkholderiaceae bacterium]|nr:hypothetical protein [Burkholderiaceae bacterium]